MELTLEPTADVLAGLLGKRRATQTIVGFAAEFGPDAVALGLEKLAAKGVDLLVVNDISRSDIGFDADANEVTILTAGAGDVPLQEHVPRASKDDVAGAILDVVERVRSGS